MDSTVTDSGAKENGSVSAELRGETIGYAFQSIGYNLIGNLFEPYINYRIQEHYSGKNHTNGKHGTYAQNLAGEFIGDFAGGSALILAEATMPKQLHSLLRSMRRAVDPLYSKLAKYFVDDKYPPEEYEKRVERWKTFQERSLCRSSIVAVTGIAANVAAQKWLVNNPSSTGVILGGKIASTALTMGLNLGARMMFPKQMNNLDKAIGGTFSGMMEDEQIEEIPSNGHAAKQARHNSYTQKVTEGREAAGTLEPTR